MRAKLTLVAVSSCVALLLMELLLRLVIAAPPRWTYPQESYEFDAEVGHRLTPGQSAYTHDKPVRINQDGLRGPDYSARATPGTVRVLGLGDSQTFGNGLEVAETWPAQLERELAGRDSAERWEVINAGLSATDTWQHEIMLRRMLDRYDPQIVVLAFYTNDVQRAYRPRPDTAIAETNTATKRVGYILKRSALLNALRDGLRFVRNRWQPSRSLLAERHIVTGDADPLVEQGWTQVEQSLASMWQLCREAEVRFVVCVLPRRDQVGRTTADQAYNDRIGAIATDLGIPIVDLLGPLQQAYRESGSALFIPWDGHNSGRANRVIAESIARKLSDPDVPVATMRRWARSNF